MRRNKIKRLLREAFRLEREHLPGAFDLVLIPQGGDGKYPLAELRSELKVLLARLLEKRSRGDATGTRSRGRGRKRP